MRNVWRKSSLILAVWTAASAFSQTPSSATLKQLMLDLIHPASNQLVLLVNRGGPANDREWGEFRHSALTLEAAGRALLEPGRVRPQKEWTESAQMLAMGGSDAYRAAQAKDVKALLSAVAAIDTSCTACHRQFRPNVFPH